MQAHDVVRHLGLEPHPEGGWFRRTWEDPVTGPDGRRRGSAISYLLDAGEVSRWHRVDAAELWHHGSGGPVELSRWAGPGHDVARAVLGPDLEAGQHPQVVVHPGEWQQARATDGWALVGCVVVPEFIAAGFELAPEGWAPPAG